MTRRALLGLGWVAMAGLVVALSRGLPPQGFFVGDCGVKLTMMYVALDHPARPLEVPPPMIGGRPAPDLFGRFYIAHGTHAHAVTSELFPLVSAPFVGLFGLRGAYVWPALGLLALLPVAYLLAARLGRRDLAMPAVAVLLLGSPVLFYSLEIWEHVPAVTLTAAATLLVLGGAETARRQWAAGLLLGFAFLFRPECVWFVPALVLVRWQAIAARGARLAGGFALVVAPLIVFNLLHSGQPFGAQVTANAAAAIRDWVVLRGPVAETWLWGARSPLALAGLALALAGAVGAWLLRARSPQATHVVRGLALLGVALISMAAMRGGLERGNLWAVFPAGLLALLPPQGPGADWARALRRLTIVFTLLVGATTSTAGGSQYGPRYLLPVCVPLALLVALNVQGLLASRGVARVVAALLLLPTVVGSLAVQRNSYRGELRMSKRIHSRIVDTLREQAGEARYVLSDLWWLDQLGASEYRSRTFLLAETRDEARQALTRLAAAGAPSLLIVRSADESLPEPTSDWMVGTCYAIVQTESIADRALSFSQARCPGPSDASTR